MSLDNQQALIPCPNTPTFDLSALLTVFRDIAGALTILPDIAASLRQIANGVTPVETELVGTDYIAAKRGFTVTYVAQMAREGKIPARCIAARNGDGEKWQFYREKVNEWLGIQKGGAPCRVNVSRKSSRGS